MYSEKPINHTLKNLHIRYVPRERLNFDTMTPDGKVALVYRSDQTSRMNVWNVILGSAIPPALFAPYLVPPDLLLYYKVHVAAGEGVASAEDAGDHHHQGAQAAVHYDLRRGLLSQNWSRGDIQLLPSSRMSSCTCICTRHCSCPGYGDGP